MKASSPRALRCCLEIENTDEPAFAENNWWKAGPEADQVGGGDGACCSTGCAGLNSAVGPCAVMGRWLASGLLLIAAVLFGLGYFLQPEVGRTLWITLSVLLPGSGLVAFFLASHVGRRERNQRSNQVDVGPEEPPRA
jgi:hypothetical protein